MEGGDEGGNVTDHGLKPGDVAVVAFQSDNPDKISLVATVDIAPGTVIKVTDDAWDNDAASPYGGAFRGSEGVVSYTVTGTTWRAGSVVTYSGDGASTPAIGWATERGSLALATGGDQLLVYAGTDLEPSFLWAVHFADSDWHPDPDSTSHTSLPAGLHDGATALLLEHKDQYVYEGPRSAVRYSLLPRLADPAHWHGWDTATQGTYPDPVAPFHITVHPEEGGFNVCYKGDSGIATRASVSSARPPPTHLCVLVCMATPDCPVCPPGANESFVSHLWLKELPFVENMLRAQDIMYHIDAADIQSVDGPDSLHTSLNYFCCRECSRWQVLLVDAHTRTHPLLA